MPGSKVEITSNANGTGNYFLKVTRKQENEVEKILITAFLTNKEILKIGRTIAAHFAEVPS